MIVWVNVIPGLLLSIVKMTVVETSVLSTTKVLFLRFGIKQDSDWAKSIPWTTPSLTANSHGRPGRVYLGRVVRL